MRTNDVRVALAGTAGWAVALVVLLLAGLPEEDRWWLWVCGVGIVTGLFGAWYIPRLQAARERQAAERAARRRAIGADTGTATGTGGDPDTGSQTGSATTGDANTGGAGAGGAGTER